MSRIRGLSKMKKDRPLGDHFLIGGAEGAIWGVASELLCMSRIRWAQLTKQKTPEGVFCFVGGAEGIRTPDPLHAMQVRYQLRHSPEPSQC
jgi:hypothetical protein